MNFIQKLCSFSVSYGMSVTEFCAFNLYVSSSIYYHVPGQQYYRLTGILSCQGEVVEMDNTIEGSHRPYEGKEAKQFTPARKLY